MKEIMKGNHALAEAAVRAGCKLFAGYPITPQSEILEYLSWRMAEEGREFVQTESEIAAINMVMGGAATGHRCMTSSSGPGFSLKQEGISYMASIELPAVVVDVMRYGFGLGQISVGQCDYFQATKGGGHGGYFVPVFAPSSVQENVDYVLAAFDVAEKYRTPVIILSDASIGQMSAAVKLPEFQEHDADSFDWALGTPAKHQPCGLKRTDCSYSDFPGEAYIPHMVGKFDAIMENEQRWEEVQTDDAEIILVAYGITSRICKEAVIMAREEGIKLGLIRPVTLWPFPTKAFEKFNGKVKGYMSVEMNLTGQMVEDVYLAAHNTTPVYNYPTGIDIADSDKILEQVKAVLRGEKEAY